MVTLNTSFKSPDFSWKNKDSTTCQPSYHEYLPFIEDNYPFMQRIPRAVPVKQSSTLDKIVTAIYQAIVQPIQKKLPTKKTLKGFWDNRKKVFRELDDLMAKPTGKSPPDTSIKGGVWSNFLFTGSIFGGIIAFVGIIKSTIQVNHGIRMLINGIKLLDNPIQAGQKKLAKSFVQTGLGKVFTGTITGLTTLGSGVIASAHIAAQIAPKLAFLKTVIVTTTCIAAPISFGLCAFGIKRNLDVLERTSKQLFVVNNELLRLQNLKQTLGISKFEDPQLAERERILLFAKRRLQDQSLDHKINIFSNSLIMIGAYLTFTGAITGLGSTALGIVGASFVIAGGSLNVFAGLALTIHRHRRKKKAMKLMAENKGPEYISSASMRAKAVEMFKTDQTNEVRYNLAKPVDKWSNSELLAFMLTRKGVGHKKVRDSQQVMEVQSAFLLADEYYWRKVFG